MIDPRRYLGSIEKNTGPEFKRCIKQNYGYLDEFQDWLEEKGYDDDAVALHFDNIDFFLDDYLINVDPIPMEEGPTLLFDFLGRYIIHDVDWGSTRVLKENVASVRLFYQCMCELGHVDQKTYDGVCTYIDENEQKWYAECEEYDDLYGCVDDEYDDDDYDLEEDEEEFQRLYRSLEWHASRMPKNSGGIVVFGL